MVFGRDGEGSMQLQYREDLEEKRIPRDSFKAIKIFIIVFFLMFFSAVCLVEAAGTPISVDPVSQTVSAGATMSITVGCVPQQPVKAFELKILFNPSLLQATVVSEGDLFDGYTTFFNPGVINNVAGTIVNVYDLIVGPGNVSGAGSLVMINFTAKSTSGTSPLSLYDVRMTNEVDYIEVSVSSASVIVTGGSSPPPYTPPPSGPPSTPPASENTPPLRPLIPSGPGLVERGITYVYRSAAVDPDGDQVRLRFDWGDGSLSNWTGFVDSNTSVSALHLWENGSNYTIRVIAQDVNGSNSSWSDPYTVMISQKETGGSPPDGWFSIPQNASASQTIVFDASGIYDTDGVVVSYLWDFGDGTTGEGKNPVHTYQFPGDYYVSLTVIDNDGLTFTLIQVVGVASGSAAPVGNDNGFLQTNSVILLTIVLVTVLMVLLVFRDKIQKIFIQKRIQTSQRRLAQFDRSTADIDQIVDALFLEMKQKTLTPTRSSIRQAYTDLIRGKAEKNPSFVPPDLSIDEIERLVDRRIQAKMNEKIDEM